MKLFTECADALLAGREPSRESALFLAGGLLAWLAEGGDLLADYWRVRGIAGSHHTPQHVFRELQENFSSVGRQCSDDVDTIRLGPLSPSESAPYE